MYTLTINLNLKSEDFRKEFCLVVTLICASNERLAKRRTSRLTWIIYVRSGNFSLVYPNRTNMFYSINGTTLSFALRQTAFYHYFQCCVLLFRFKCARCKQYWKQSIRTIRTQLRLHIHRHKKYVHFWNTHMFHLSTLLSVCVRKCLWRKKRKMQRTTRTNGLRLRCDRSAEQFNNDWMNRMLSETKVVWLYATWCRVFNEITTNIYILINLLNICIYLYTYDSSDPRRCNQLVNTS